MRGRRRSGDDCQRARRSMGLMLLLILLDLDLCRSVYSTSLHEASPSATAISCNLLPMTPLVEYRSPSSSPVDQLSPLNQNDSCQAHRPALQYTRVYIYLLRLLGCASRMWGSGCRLVEL